MHSHQQIIEARMEKLDAMLGGFMSTAEAHRQTVLAMVDAIPARTFRATIATLAMFAGIILGGIRLLDYLYPPAAVESPAVVSEQAADQRRPTLLHGTLEA